MVRSLSDPSRVTPLNAFPSVAHPSMSPGGNMVAVGNWRGDRTVVWDVHSGRVITELLPGQRTVAVAFSPAAGLLVTGSSGEYRFWQTGTWTEVLKVKRPERFSNLPGKIAFSPDGSLVALVMDQTSIQLLECPGLTVIANLHLDEPQSVTGICFGPEGRRLFLSSAANQIHVWNFAPIATELSRFSIGLEFAMRNWTGGPARRPELRTVTQAVWPTGPLPTMEAASAAGNSH